MHSADRAASPSDSSRTVAQSVIIRAPCVPACSIVTQRVGFFRPWPSRTPRGAVVFVTAVPPPDIMAPSKAKAACHRQKSLHNLCRPKRKPIRLAAVDLPPLPSLMRHRPRGALTKAEIQHRMGEGGVSRVDAPAMHRTHLVYLQARGVVPGGVVAQMQIGIPTPSGVSSTSRAAQGDSGHLD